MIMFSIFDKINIIQVVVGHARTFGYRSCGIAVVKDVVLFVGIPVMLCVGCGFLQAYGYIKGIPSECWNIAVTITSIFTPLTLSLLTSLYSMKEKLSPNPRAIKLLQEVVYNICYAIVVSLFLLIIAVCVKALAVESTVWGSGVFVALFSHLMLTLLMIIKRFVALFLEAVNQDT